MNRMKARLIQTSIFILFVCALAASVYGSLTTETIPSRAVGAMQIAPFETGLALYQGYRGQYYSISPFNDYTITKEGTRSAYIPYELIASNRFTTSYRHSHLDDIYQTLSSFFLRTPATITFTSDRYKISYKAEITGNKTLIHRQVHDMYSWGNPPFQAMTIPYKGPDFVFDSLGELHHYQLPQDIETFEKMYNIDLEQNLDEITVTLRKTPLLIVNPYISGAIVIRPQENQNLIVDRNNKLITIEQAILEKDGDYDMSIQLEVYPDPNTAFKAL